MTTAPSPPGPPSADTPVVIVGAGPVGMFLALDLASHGIRSTVTEQNTTYRSCPKGNTHNPLG